MMNQTQKREEYEVGTVGSAGGQREKFRPETLSGTSSVVSFAGLCWVPRRWSWLHRPAKMGRDDFRQPPGFGCLE